MKISFKYEVKPADKLSPYELVNLIISHRQIKNVKEFLNPPSPLTISLLDFDKKYRPRLGGVIKLLKEIKKNNQMIVVYTDYDADGITGGAILWETLHLLGFKVMPYVPDRKKEGYGFLVIGIDNVIKEFDPVLIISVDHGITKVKEIEYAKKKGIKIIITDHHLKAEKTPKAEAIFHVPALSGSGVAYFFAKEIFNQFQKQLSGRTSEVEEERSDGKTSEVKLRANFQTDYLALASIGTIADLVSLVGPSRSIVKHGLEAFSKVKRFGIKHILKQAGIEGKKITPYEVGFIIAPRINAVGRLKHALDALRLLCTTDEKKAYELSHQIGNLNTERQDLVEKSVTEAKNIIRGRTSEVEERSGKTSEVKLKDKMIILVSEKWHEGIIGLIASKIAEEFYRPTIVLTKTDGHYKGSARSIPSFHITEFLRSLKKHLVDVGGHAQAAGFTIEEKKLTSFTTTATKLANKLIKDKDLERIIIVDIKIPVSKINLEIVKSLETLEPFGIGNPRPTFYSEGILTDAKLFGKTNNHLKIFVDSLELIAFNQGEKFKQLSRGQKIKVVYSLEIDRWNGREKLRGKIVFM
ncbi:MAG: Single-stranded-DNA-specific exonuclease RecJ [Candidatus Roizmanbacteria bacterium GW2011_GWC2_37_13]|uniref:Single-stranded-DNA-specific exonuclease RecJ n=1 Tax=Candidatus Roizmanbacteria bacterium GW2011_GWC2_37_13 TaxID=1618486 RepID=A0A0G0G2M6_9BACT|nr:MAG: Single-stranded-DNA-specific exonuclease RecJ [Candidatus Roizmanbacteria bacterium GW2011_GWC1_37_12]KKQ25448.1 MAG: Single-stranded-DNA-specific exonuclease RecJ [Candidatus Roizmanbacteria bacterium GW2011_GWC2_37_13]